VTATNSIRRRNTETPSLLRGEAGDRRRTFVPGVDRAGDAHYAPPMKRVALIAVLVAVVGMAE